MKRHQRPMTALDAIFSAVADPGGTMHHLLVERPHPPFIVLILALLLTTILVPPLAFRYKNEMPPLDTTLPAAMAMTIAATFVFFVVISIIMLRLLGVTAPAIKVTAAAVYAMAPIIPMLLGFYIGNYLVSGNLDIIRYQMTGNVSQNDYFTPYFPATLKLTLFLCFLVYLQALKALGSMTTLSAFFTAVLSLALLLASAFAGMTLCESIYPDSGAQIVKSLGSLFVVTQRGA